MAIETMKRVRLTTHKSVSEEIFAGIQKLGCCHIIPGGHERAGEEDIAVIRSRARHVDELLGEVRFVMRFIDPYATEKGGGMAKALGDAPSYSAAELKALASEDELLRTAESVRSMEKRLSDVKSALSRVSGIISSLSPLAGLPYSLDFYTKGTETVRGVVLQAAPQALDGMVSSLSLALGDSAEIFVPPAPEGVAGRIVSVIYSREAEDKFQSAISSYQTSRVEAPHHLSGTAADELERCEAELSALKSDEAAVIREITEVANKAYKRCENCSDYWSIQRDKYGALMGGEQTAQVIVSEFWIPEPRVGELKKLLAPHAAATDVSFSDPGTEDKPPTLLNNKKFAVPVEPLIEMYGTPTYGGFDPTAVVAPFFYAFFGICFGDAGYGLLIASLLTALMMKKRITGTLRKFLMILIIGNVCALIFGALTFSWFGDSIDAFPFLAPLREPLKKLRILDPMNDPMTMLGVSLAFGFVQIMFGLAIALMENLRKGDRMAAFADQGGWIVFLCGLVLVGLSSSGSVPVPSGVSAAVAATGAVILLTTQGRSKESFLGKAFSGLMSLYNVTSYLGDLLSYSRLLALGLGSAAVGMVINMLAGLVAPSLNGFGVIFGILIFVLGHLFSMVVNLLGAFVHPLRLQYVEFFSKFHEASGEEFIPLSIATQYVELKEEIN
ncbi:MAG: V-type ATP synthase subunit I [Synergistaceae bacterium]|jgi:V/A-type H+-transporting ATPase subunit I|nr:V-type ATP synthase subunit I [Synergistaceae bacterium]